MVDKEESVKTYIKGLNLIQENNLTDKTLIRRSYLDGFEVAEAYYKDIAVKFARYYTEYTLEFMKSGEKAEKLILPKKSFEIFLKTLENEQ